MPILVASVAIAAADIARRIFRHSQIFCPSTEPKISWNPVDYGIPAGAVEEHVFETPDGEELYGWYCRSEKPVASSVFCHGNTGNLTTSAEVIPHLLNAGLNILHFDYRGFGRSTGIPTVRGVISDGITASRFHDRIRPKDLPTVLYGYSLGGGIASQILRRHPFDGLILQSTFTSLSALARVTWPRLPVHLFAGKVFDTLSVVRKLQVPLLVIHGADDEAIPCWMAHSLHDSCSTMPKRIHVVNGGLHKDLYLRDADQILWQISQFIAELPRTHRTYSVEEPPVVEHVTDLAMRALRRLLFRRKSAQHAL